MKALPFLFIASILTLCTARPAPAVMTEYSTTNRNVAVTNVLPATEVHPLAAYLIFPAPSTGTVSISRVTRGVAVPLARHGFTNIAALTWLPPADYPIRRGEAFAISSTVARFTLQLESSNDGSDIQRTDAPEWFDDGRPFTAQAAGGGSTTLVVTNIQTVVVTNAPHFTVTNIVNVTTGGEGGPQFDVGMSGEYKATNNIIVSGNGENRRLIWYDGSGGSLKYNNSAFVFQGNGSYEYNVNFGFDSLPNNGDVLTYDSMSAMWKAAAASGGSGAYIPSLGPWGSTNNYAAVLTFDDNEAAALTLASPMWGSDSSVSIGVGTGSSSQGYVSGGGVMGAHWSLNYNALQIAYNDGMTGYQAWFLIDNAGNATLDDDLGTPVTLATIRAAPQWVAVPASATAAGTPGQVAYDGSYLYVCVATDTWVRTALSTW